jgi:hypothetical protein
VSGYDHERLLPAGPDLTSQAQKRRSEHEVGATSPSLVDGELVAQGEILDSELAVAVEEDGEEPKQVSRRGTIELR